MAHVFTVTVKIGDTVQSTRDYVIAKWIDLDGVAIGTGFNAGTIANPLHPEDTYRTCRFSCNDSGMEGVLASAPDIIDIGNAGASSATLPKTVEIKHKASGFYYIFDLYPVTGSSTNAHIGASLKWGANTTTGFAATNRVYTPQSCTFQLCAVSKSRTEGGVTSRYLGFLCCISGGDYTSSANTNYIFSAEERMYGNQADPLPTVPTQGGGGFGTLNNSTDVTVNIGAKPAGFLGGILGGSGFNLYFVPSYHDLIRAAYYSLNGVNNLSEFFNNTAALFLSPSTYIVSATAIPVDKSVFGAGALQSTIRLGGLVSFNVSCYPLSSVYGDTDVYTFNFDGMYYDSFMDFEPYTKVTLFLPYIGFVPLRPSECVGGQITVQYRFEALSGKCVAFVKTTDRNGRNTGFYQYNGCAGFALPWVGNNGGGSQLLHSAAAAGIALAMDAKGAAGNVAAFAKEAAHFAAQDSRPTMQGGFGINSGALGADEITLFIQRAQHATPAHYYDIHGYQTATGGTVGDYSGYTSFAYVELDTVTATDAEKAELETILKGGVFL